eukprot:TRINITY_DN9765_c0_g1_i3.p1 TRINITY_DN9765_c0_g1~~TRINITY_DN9765_c0_g1_i3.p1  ORF type:complete len:358 (+),score=34.68 TRINITY_DN9765_c0_g1_i3:234-1307(+)
MWEEHGDRGWIQPGTQEHVDHQPVRTDLEPPAETLAPELPVPVQHIFYSSVTPDASPVHGELDSDGDPILPRRKKRRAERTLTLTQRYESTLPDCGLQLWAGAMVLCDFIMAHRELFSGAQILELGAGVGLVSALVAPYCARVVSTDLGTEVLEVLEKNLTQNQATNATVRRLDLLEPGWPPNPNDKTRWRWRPSEHSVLGELDVVLCSDIVYDRRVTAGLVAWMTGLSVYPRPPVVFLAMERRINFSVESLRVESREYDFLQRCLGHLPSDHRTDSYELGLMHEFGLLAPGESKGDPAQHSTWKRVTPPHSELEGASLLVSEAVVDRFRPEQPKLRENRAVGALAGGDYAGCRCGI